MPSVSSAQDRAPLTHRAITKIALPVMIADISTPLIGVVDTAVVGQIPAVGVWLFFTSEAADDSLRVDLGGRRII